MNHQLNKTLSVILVLFAALCLSCAVAQPYRPRPTIPKEYQGVFEIQTWVGNNVVIPYRLAKINVDGASDETAVVVYLHGGSAKGNDNTKQMRDQVYKIYDYLKDSGIPAVFIIPQCQREYKGWDVPEVQTQMKALIDHWAGDGRTGQAKVYLIGASMGAIGVMNMISSYPGYVTAAMPVGFSASFWDPATLTGTPIICVRGSEDHSESNQEMADFFQRINDAGGNVQYELKKGWTHRKTYEKAFTKDRLKQLFDIKK